MSSESAVDSKESRAEVEARVGGLLEAVGFRGDTAVGTFFGAQLPLQFYKPISVEKGCNASMLECINFIVAYAGTRGLNSPSSSGVQEIPHSQLQVTMAGTIQPSLAVPFSFSNLACRSTRLTVSMRPVCSRLRRELYNQRILHLIK